MSYTTTKVESSNIDTIAYDDETRELVVGFLNGSVYKYYAVPPVVGNGFQYAESAGKYLWGAVRNKFEYERLA